MTKQTKQIKAGGSKPLAAKRQKFIDEYLVDLNAAQAAVRAGYSEATARQTGHKLLTNADIQEAIIERRAALSTATGVTVERVLREAARLAFFDVRKLYRPDGSPKQLNELDDDTAAAIQGLEVATIGNKDVGFGEVLKYKVADKNAAIEKLFKHLGMFDRDNAQQAARAPLRIELVPLQPEAPAPKD